MGSIDIELGAKLAKSRQTLAEVTAAEREHDAASRDLAKRILELERIAADDKELALLDQRAPNAKLDEHAEAMRLRYHASLAKLQTARGAMLRQGKICDALAADISARHRAVVLARVQPLGDRLAKLLREAVDVSAEISGSLAGEYVHPTELFAGLADHESLIYRAGFLHSLAMAAALAQYDADMVRKLGWRAA